MDLEKASSRILQQYQNYTDILIGLSFLRNPFADDFRSFVGIKKDADFIKAFEAFMKTAHQIFRWNDYYEARTTAEKSFRQFYEAQHYPEDKLDEAVKGFILSFFMQNIDERLMEWEDNHPGEEYSAPQDSKDDIDNLFLSRVFACAADIGSEAENKAFCDSIGVNYDYEQLHMCVWFSGQITNGVGQYSRDEINYSARTTYNRLLNPSSLLWIGVIMGADKNELKAAAEEMAGKKTNAAKCGAVRSHVPFDVILQLYQKMMTDDIE